MDTKHCIALIITPLQYLNLLEFYNQNKNLDKKKCVVILISHYKKSIEQIEKIGYLSSFEKIIKPMVFSRNIVLNFFYTLTLYLKYKNRTPILGNINNVWCRSYLKNKTIPYVLDDGTGSIIIFNNRNQNNYELVEKEYKPTNKLSLLTELILKPKIIYTSPIHFFSVYNGLEASKKDNIKINSYSFLQSQIFAKEKVKLNECWFIGAPLADLGLVEQKKLEVLIENISIFFMKKNIKKVRYFGHRTEKFVNINNENITIENNEMPFEIYYQSSEVKPKIIASFFSSVLKNIEVTDKSIELFSFYIPEYYRAEKLKKKWSVNHQQVYDYFENHTRIQVIKNYN